MALHIPLGASTVITLETSSTPTSMQTPGPVQQTDPGTREEFQAILRTAVELLMEDRTNRAPGQSVERPLPKTPQMLQTLQGMPGAPRAAPAQAKTGQSTVGLRTVMLQHQ